MSIPARAASGPIERVLDELLAGPLPEALARSMVEHRVLERFAGELAKRGDLEVMAVSALESEQAERLARRVLASPALEQLLVQAVESPALQQALNRLVQDPEFQQALGEVLAQQTTGFAEHVVGAARKRAVAADDVLERLPRRLFRKQVWTGDPGYAGLGSRGIALAIDALLANVIFVTTAALVNLVASLFGGLRPHWLAATIGGVGLLLVVVVYFVAFWATVGQTPGMGLMRLRVLDRSDEPPGVARSLVRFAGLVLAIVPLFAGCLPALVDDRRRALQDFLAGTVVVYVDEVQLPPAPP